MKTALRFLYTIKLFAFALVCVTLVISSLFIFYQKNQIISPSVKALGSAFIPKFSRSHDFNTQNADRPLSQDTGVARFGELVDETGRTRFLAIVRGSKSGNAYTGILEYDNATNSWNKVTTVSINLSDTGITNGSEIAFYNNHLILTGAVQCVNGSVAPAPLSSNYQARICNIGYVGGNLVLMQNDIVLTELTGGNSWYPNMQQLGGNLYLSIASNSTSVLSYLFKIEGFANNNLQLKLMRSCSSGGTKYCRYPANSAQTYTSFTDFGNGNYPTIVSYNESSTVHGPILKSHDGKVRIFTSDTTGAVGYQKVLVEFDPVTNRPIPNSNVDLGAMFGADAFNVMDSIQYNGTDSYFALYVYRGTNLSVELIRSRYFCKTAGCFQSTVTDGPFSRYSNLLAGGGFSGYNGTIIYGYSMCPVNVSTNTCSTPSSSRVVQNVDPGNTNTWSKIPLDSAEVTPDGRTPDLQMGSIYYANSVKKVFASYRRSFFNAPFGFNQVMKSPAIWVMDDVCPTGCLGTTTPPPSTATPPPPPIPPTISSVTLSCDPGQPGNPYRLLFTVVTKMGTFPIDYNSSWLDITSVSSSNTIKVTKSAISPPAAGNVVSSYLPNTWILSVNLSPSFMQGNFYNSGDLNVTANIFDTGGQQAVPASTGGQDILDKCAGAFYKTTGGDFRSSESDTSNIFWQQNGTSYMKKDNPDNFSSGIKEFVSSYGFESKFDVSRCTNTSKDYFTLQQQSGQGQKFCSQVGYPSQGIRRDNILSNFVDDLEANVTNNQIKQVDIKTSTSVTINASTYKNQKNILIKVTSNSVRFIDDSSPNSAENLIIWCPASDCVLSIRGGASVNTTNNTRVFLNYNKSDPKNTVDPSTIARRVMFEEQGNNANYYFGGILTNGYIITDKTQFQNTLKGFVLASGIIANSQTTGGSNKDLYFKNFFTTSPQPFLVINFDPKYPLKYLSVFKTNTSNQRSFYLGL